MSQASSLTPLTFFYNFSFMFELLAKLNINFATKDQILEVLDKCNTVLAGGIVLLMPLCWKLIKEHTEG